MTIAAQAAGLGPTRQPATRAYPLASDTVIVVERRGPWLIYSLAKLPPCQAHLTLV